MLCLSHENVNRFLLHFMKLAGAYQQLLCLLHEINRWGVHFTKWTMLQMGLNKHIHMYVLI